MGPALFAKDALWKFLREIIVASAFTQGMRFIADRHACVFSVNP